MTVCFCCRGNVTKVVNIVVISEDTLYCPLVITRTNKGTFHWPKTVSGVTVELQCDTGRKDICLHYILLRGIGLIMVCTGKII